MEETASNFFIGSGAERRNQVKALCNSASPLCNSVVQSDEVIKKAYTYSIAKRLINQ